MQRTLFSSANFLARGLAKIRSPAGGGGLCLTVFGSGERTGSSTTSFFGGLEAGDSAADAAPVFDEAGL